MKRKTNEMTDAFAACHPVVNFIYFVCVIGCAMASLHPVCLCIAFAGAFAYSVCLGGIRAVGRNLRYMIPLVLLTAVINPAFSHQGVTTLAYLPSGNPLTMESILYGIAAAGMLITTLCWFGSFNRIMTSDKTLDLFGRVAPTLSLVLSMTLKFIPEYNSRVRRIYHVQALAGEQGSGKYFKKVRRGLHALSISATWALERAVVTGDSMKSRGYATGRRTAYSLFRFHRRDIACLVFILSVGFYVVIGFARGAAAWSYYPYISVWTIDWYRYTVFVGYILLVGMPTAMHIWANHKIQLLSFLKKEKWSQT